MKGLFVGIFKLIGGLIGAIVGLMFALSLISNEKSTTPSHQSVSPARQLDIYCQEGSNTQPTIADKAAFYENCISGGQAVLKARKRIDEENLQSLHPSQSKQENRVPILIPTETKQLQESNGLVEKQKEADTTTNTQPVSESNNSSAAVVKE